MKQVHHYSEQNKSNKSRHVYTFHVVESHNCVWDKLNWLDDFYTFFSKFITTKTLF